MDQVFELRQVLQFTYVFAYYLEDAHEKLLFEFLQQQLEQSTEKLSELSESPLEKIDRALVVNYTRVTQQFMCNLLNGVEEGLTMNTPGNGEV
jgi:ariadne-1